MNKYQVEKKDLWPKEGKLKKGLIILVIVIVGALLMTLAEEKTKIKFTKKVPFVIALACIGVWIYKPAKKEE
jgi:hypothetical protein